MPLVTKEIFERAKKILNEKIGNHDASCSICGHEKRSLHPNILSIPNFPLVTSTILGGLDTIGAVFVDLMITTCDNCGHVDFFNAHMLEALRPESEDAEAEVEAPEEEDET